jgi:transposase-like protein
MSVYTVKDWAEQFRAGKFRTSLPPSVQGYSEEFKAKALELHEQKGMTPYRIAKVIGISHTTCLKWIKATSALKKLS